MRNKITICLIQFLLCKVCLYGVDTSLRVGYVQGNYFDAIGYSAIFPIEPDYLSRNGADDDFWGYGYYVSLEIKAGKDAKIPFGPLRKDFDEEYKSVIASSGNVDQSLYKNDAQSRLFSNSFITNAGVNQMSDVAGGGNINCRNSLVNSAAAFASGKATAAFLGGSITEMEGYRPMVCRMLRQMYPATDFEFINAGVASTCSTTGAFRLERDVLSRGRIDLLFVEFAVNDEQDAAHTAAECVKGMEGILRHTLLANPLADVVFLYSANESHIADYQSGFVPAVIAAHEAVARAYGVCSVNFAREVAARMKAGEFDWEKFGGVHPADFGNQIYAKLISDLFDRCLNASNAAAANHILPAPLDSLSYFHGQMLGADKAKADSNWHIGMPQWQEIQGQVRERFASENMLHSEKAGAALELDFDGTAIGLYVLAGPDAGIVEYRVDGSLPKTADLYHRFSKALHYPRTVMLETELAAGSHKLELRIADGRNAQSTATAVRIMAFAVNSPARRP